MDKFFYNPHNYTACTRAGTIHVPAHSFVHKSLVLEEERDKLTPVECEHLNRLILQEKEFGHISVNIEKIEEAVEHSRCPECYSDELENSDFISAHYRCRRCGTITGKKKILEHKLYLKASLLELQNDLHIGVDLGAEGDKTAVCVGRRSGKNLMLKAWVEKQKNFLKDPPIMVDFGPVEEKILNYYSRPFRKSYCKKSDLAELTMKNTTDKPINVGSVTIPSGTTVTGRLSKGKFAVDDIPITVKKERKTNMERSEFYRNCGSEIEEIGTKGVHPGDFIRLPVGEKPTSSSFIKVIIPEWKAALEKCWLDIVGNVVTWEDFEEEYEDQNGGILDTISSNLRMQKKSGMKKVKKYSSPVTVEDALAENIKIRELLKRKGPGILEAANGDLHTVMVAMLEVLSDAGTKIKTLEADVHTFRSEESRRQDGTMFSRTQSHGVIRRVRKMRTPCDDQSGEDICADAEPGGSWRP